jgi:hypothetical protein
MSEYPSAEYFGQQLWCDDNRRTNLMEELVDEKMTWKAIQRYDTCSVFYFPELVEPINLFGEYEVFDLEDYNGPQPDVHVYNRKMHEGMIAVKEFYDRHGLFYFTMDRGVDIVVFSIGNHINPLIAKLATGMNVIVFPFSLFDYTYEDI